MNRAIYFDSEGKPHEALIQITNEDQSAKILYNPKEFTRNWDLDTKDWLELNNVNPKAEPIEGQPIPTINCYKLIKS